MMILIHNICSWIMNRVHVMNWELNKLERSSRYPAKILRQLSPTLIYLHCIERRRQIERRCHRFHPQGRKRGTQLKGQKVAYVKENTLALGHGMRNGGEVVVRKYNIGGFFGNVRASFEGWTGIILL